MHASSYHLPQPWESALAGWLTWLIASGASLATRRTRRVHVRYIARTLALEHPRDVTTADLLAILGRPDRSQDHRRGMRNSLASFYRWCVSAGVVTDDPTATLPVVRATLGAPKPATDEVWQYVLEHADARTLLMARLAAEAGLRRAEVAQVHSDDLIDSIDGPELIVHGKGNKQRVVPISASLATDLRRSCPCGGFVFPGRINGHIGADAVGQLVSRAMPAGYSMHKLRHRFATRAYRGSHNLRAVQTLLGHASVATTERYTAVSTREIRAVAEAAADRGGAA